MKYFYYTFITLLFYTGHTMGQSYPDGFYKELAYDNFTVPAGMLHTDSDYTFVWELDGKVWMINNGVVFDNPVIDISEEVGFWGDQGMIGAALDPNFLENGYIYLLYSVDRHHLLYFGTPDYNPSSSQAFAPSIGRITRFQLNTVDFQFAIPDSRHVLIGDQIDNGFPISAPSHGVGSLVFGADGSLLASCGDGSTWVLAEDGLGFNGTGPLPNFAYDSAAVEQGTLPSHQMLGAYRAQSLHGLNGKVIRIDPETGLGLPDNPYFEESNPQSPISKIWALGLRNPYRMVLRPETGSATSPGTIYLSDVGDWVWEEINVIVDPGKNFGWPLYQGQDVHYTYYNKNTQNTFAENPLGASGSGCSPFFNFQDLITLPNQSHSELFPNPCNPAVLIPELEHTFALERPAVAYTHSVADVPVTKVPGFDSQGNSEGIIIDDFSDVEGESFSGIGGSGGIFLTGESIPEEYQGWYIQGDYSGWLRAFKFNSDNSLAAVEFWDDEIGAPIHVSQDPSDGCIYVTTIGPSNIYRICFGGNRKPVAQCSPDIVFGVSPQNVEFDASDSYDPDGEIVSYQWTLSNGITHEGISWDYVLTAPDNALYNMDIKLVVTDNEGAKDSVQVPISLNNTPPQAEIVSIDENQLLAIYSPTSVNLVAAVQDTEHSSNQMTYDWILYLHHNEHFHRLDDLEGNNQSYLLFPPGCNEQETYWFRVFLKVTDPGGLSDEVEVELFPDCTGETDQNNEEAEMILYPNPAENLIKVQANYALGDFVEYKIVSPEGKEIISHSIPIYSNRRYFEIDVSYLSQGGYILELETGGVKERLRFVKSLE